MSLRVARFHHNPAVQGSRRAGALQDALARSRADVLAWLDPGVVLDAKTLNAACEPLLDEHVAAVTLKGHGRRLTRLGVPIPLGSDAADAVLYAPAGLALYHRQRVLDAGGF